MSLAAAHTMLDMAMLVKSDIEFRLMILTARQQALLARSNEIADNKITRMQQYISHHIRDDDVTYEAILYKDPQFLEFDRDLAFINAQDKAMTLEKQSLEVRHKAMTQIVENSQKAVDNNLKAFKGGLGT